jgi:hypothetical protein
MRHAWPALTLCPDGACTTTGALEAPRVHAVIATELDAIGQCYQYGAVEDTGTIEVELTIDPAGKVQDARGRGLDDAGPCVAEVIAALAFPPAARPTRVAYTVAYRPQDL